MQDEPKKLCFVTSIFGESLRRADKPSHVKDLVDCARYRFYIFTNLWDLKPQGWTKLAKYGFYKLPYSRMITNSRYGKFLAWKEPEVRQSCRAVFYMDGYVKPRLEESDKFYALAHNLTTNPTQDYNNPGLAQVLHPAFQGLSIKEIFEGIVGRQKDMPEHTNLTFNWLQSQPDYQTHLPYYLNKFFGKLMTPLDRFSCVDVVYVAFMAPVTSRLIDISLMCLFLVSFPAYDPNSPTFQKLSSFFWQHYSSEVGSWRDQPLWAYTLHHFNITPLVLTTEGEIEKGGDLFRHGGLMGWKGHVYKRD
jgi:hypothetical protein